MKKTVLLISTLFIISCGGGGGGGGGDDTPTSPSTTSYTATFTGTTPSASSNYVKLEEKSVSGDTVTISVKAVDITEPVGGVAIDVTYNTSKLSFVSASNGDMVSGSTASFAATDSSGTVIISASDVIDASPDSDGTLFTIKFKGIATGSGSVGIANSSLFNAAGDSGGIAVSGWYGGTVTVQ